MNVVERLFVAPKRGAPMVELTAVEAIRGAGLRGDRYADAKHRKSPAHQLTLIEAENIEAFVAAAGLSLTPDLPRRNVLTRGVRLNELVGRRFRVGAALVEGLELCEPCRLFAARTYTQVLPFFAGKGGLRAAIIAGGVIAVGDLVVDASDRDR